MVDVSVNVTRESKNLKNPNFQRPFDYPQENNKRDTFNNMNYNSSGNQQNNSNSNDDQNIKQTSEPSYQNQNSRKNTDRYSSF